MASTPLPSEEIDALKLLCASVSTADESNLTYLLLVGLTLPTGCAPSVVDALLCLSERDGYPTRLFFAEPVSSKVKL